MIIVWLKFVVCVLVILFAGRNVAKYGDIIADKTGLGGLWIGAVLIAAATSLPELFTGISAVAILKAPDLAIGDLFGANTFNLLNLALLDIAHRQVPIYSKVSQRHTLTAGLSIVMIAFPATCLLINGLFTNLAVGWMGFYTPIIFILYLIIIREIYKYERKEQAKIATDIEPATEHQGVSLKRAYIYYGIAAIFIIGAGTWLAFIGKEIADLTGWEQSFIGSLFIAFTTTLPEITVSYSALRIGAIDLCVANMIGSNIFNMMIIGILDLFYTEAPILSSVSQNHVFTALIVLIMSGVFIAALFARPQRKTFIKASWYSIALVLIFVLGAYVSFIM
jgi:cation:H+ antiporter